jgi:hypothetical protein
MSAASAENDGTSSASVAMPHLVNLGNHKALSPPGLDCSRIEFPEIAHVAPSRACNDPNWITHETESTH